MTLTLRAQTVVWLFASFGLVTIFTDPGTLSMAQVLAGVPGDQQAGECIVTVIAINGKSGLPLRDFKVLRGYGRDLRRIAGWPNEIPAASKNGAFSFKIDGNESRAACAILPGYYPARSRDFRAAEGDTTLTMQMYLLAPLHIPVFQPDGKSPATNAYAQYAKAGATLSLPCQNLVPAWNETMRNAVAPECMITGANGVLNFTAPDYPFALIVIHPTGYAELAYDKLANLKEIVLTAWASVRGQIRSQVTPYAGHSVYVSTEHPFTFDWPEIFENNCTTTDAHGNYLINRVFPGSVELSHGIFTEVTSPTIDPCYRMEALPGKELRWNFGGEGRRVSVVIESTSSTLDWSKLDCELMPEANHAGTLEPHVYLYRALATRGMVQFFDVLPGPYRVLIKLASPPDYHNSGNSSTAIAKASKEIIVAAGDGVFEAGPVALKFATTNYFDLYN